ncbi:MAG: ATP-dependent Clp protease proteolytic subunit, partial [Bacillota bacterium]|nr:ATP-dependent Clp protease proteolytic subunit [Bacillota bacterium]
MNRQKSLFYMALILIAVISMTFIPVFGQDENDHVYVIPLEGEVGVAMEQFLAAALITVQNDPQLKGIIFDIDTYGGRIDSAENISDMIIALEVPTAAYVNPRAISAGVLITISADVITMAPGSNIGSAETIPDTEKALSAWTGVLRSVAEEKGRDPELVAAMADQSIEIENLVDSGKLLNLTASEALEIGLSDNTSRGLQEVLNVLELSDATLIEVEVSRAVRLAQILTSVYVAPVLLSIGFIGLLMEILT